MSLDRIKKWLWLCGVPFLLVNTALAQTPPPFVGYTDDFQWFAPPEFSHYGDGPDYTRTGYFASVEYITWWFSNPELREVGEAGSREVYTNYGTVTQTNSFNTSWITSNTQNGARYEFGNVDEDGKGWFFSGFQLPDQYETFVGYDAAMVFDDVTNSGTLQQVTLSDGSTLVIPGGPTTLPLLNGFVDVSQGGGTGDDNFSADGFDDDINRNNLYGRYGRDMIPLNGTPQAEVPANAAPPGNVLPGSAYQPIDYGDAVALPVLFDSLTMQQRIRNYGVELSRSWNLGRGYHGGEWTFFGGARFWNFTDQFSATGVGGVLADSYWSIQANNRIVGPQLGLRWAKQRDRLSLITEGRAMAGGNFQSTQLNGEIGSELTQLVVFNHFEAGEPIPTNPGGGPVSTRSNQPLLMNRSTFNSRMAAVEFSPLVEFRAKGAYQLFRSVSLTAGWTGIWTQNIARGSKMIHYQLPNFSILDNSNKQMVWVNGFDLGIAINR